MKLKMEMMKAEVKMDFAAGALDEAFMSNHLQDACGDGGKSAVSNHADLNGKTGFLFQESGEASNFSSECSNGAKTPVEQEIQKSISNIRSGGVAAPDAIGTSAPTGALKAGQAGPSRVGNKAFHIEKSMDSKANLFGRCLPLLPYYQLNSLNGGMS